ncbi:hypothetical protein [Actinoplanes sp. NPDC026619]|uniref:hypothetical protein n=1 Tax=Actinoplanes sp. NPDC026619 TaxID=3155798 RepID=UPI0033C345C6
MFAKDIKPEPRSYAEAFLNVRPYVTTKPGGHFAAGERPGRTPRTYAARSS